MDLKLKGPSETNQKLILNNIFPIELYKIKKFNKFFDFKFKLTLILLFFILDLFLNKHKNEKLYNMFPFTKSKNINNSFKISGFNYTKTNYDTKNIRYHFKNLFNKRKIFKIDYSFYPYKKINKSSSYDINANNIYILTGMLNITKLNYYYYNLIENYNSKLNHIHLSMSFDKNYILLSSISIASILNTSNSNTFIHFHLILNNCSYNDFKLLINLKKINKNVEFIFYNGKQAEYDFEKKSKNSSKGIGDYSRLIIPEIVNITNKLLMMDSADILAIKDLSEIYYYDLEDNYFACTLDIIAGNYEKKQYIFARNKFYTNSGIVLVNITKYRRDNLYQKSFFVSIAYDFFPCPYQDILFIISNFNFKYLPLNFNSLPFYDKDEQIIKKQDTKLMKVLMEFQKYSPFRYDYNEIKNAGLDPVIVHLLGSNKPFLGRANKRYTLMWIKYAYMIGINEKLKKLFPKPFIKFEKFIKQKKQKYC